MYGRHRRGCRRLPRPAQADLGSVCWRDGAKGKNFHNEMVSKYGYADVAAEIQDLYLSGRKKEATALVPDELCDEISLCGPPARIRERFKGWDDAGVSTMMVQSSQPEALALMADVAGTNQ